MATPTIASTTTTNPQTAAQATNKSVTGFGDNFSTFLTLLTTQLKNQDPMSPLDTNQFTSQLVQFSQVEQAIGTNTKLSTLVSMASTTQAVAALPLVGHAVEYDGASATLAGGKAQFSYTLPSTAATSVLTVTNDKGQIVWKGTGETGEGRHDFTWDGKATDGSTQPAGTYTLAVAAERADKSAIIATTTATGRVDGIELKDGQPLMSIGGLKVPTTKMLAIKDTI